ncbi:Dynein 8 kDa light chain, flagellar outer arm [Anabarilius grahami]|uniref:Dynein light chain n=1 Tax=Anabarilius grahami TaxID=495550 RepID=A0A3N0XMA1_ANAGA|nr:Dynein 8 kDa light chain, flagellar outer arm [Anabarilius grahami]
MSEELEREAFQVALVAVTIYTIENDMAKYIGKEFERKHGGTWQCIMGRSTMPKTSIRRSDMSDEMECEALQVALLAVNMYEKNEDIAHYIKTEFNRKHGNYWQCIVGNFASSVTHNKNSYIDFSVGDENITLFKTD